MIISHPETTAMLVLTSALVLLMLSFGGFIVWYTIYAVWVAVRRKYYEDLKAVFAFYGIVAGVIVAMTVIYKILAKFYY